MKKTLSIALMVAVGGAGMACSGDDGAMVLRVSVV